MPRKPFLVLWKVVLCSASSCVPVRSNSFCTGVTWNVSLGLPAAEVDEKAREDFEHVFAKYGKVAPTPACLEAWKALNCARKFPRCSKHVTAHTVCRSLCVQFANACNASESLLMGKAACLDAHNFDEPPCTDYAEPLRTDHAGWTPDKSLLAGGSLEELLHTAMAAPIVLALVVALLHCTCCVVQSACGGGSVAQADAAQPAREALRDLILSSGEGMQLVGGR